MGDDGISTLGGDYPTSDGLLRVFNRPMVQNIVQTAISEKQAETRRSGGAVGRSSASTSSYPTRENAYLGSPLHSVQGGTYKSKTKDVSAKLGELRTKDQRAIVQTVDRHKELRERRFQRLLNAVTGEDV